MSCRIEGRYLGIGVGPGDPELLTLKAILALKSCAIVVYPANQDGDSMALDIVSDYLLPDTETYPVQLDFTRDRTQAEAAYKQAARDISSQLSAGLDVGILCLGDPLFHGSFLYLHQHLRDKHPWQVIPGISAPFAAAARVGKALAMQQEHLTILPGHDDSPKAQQALQGALAQGNSVVVMKAGRRRQAIAAQIRAAGRAADAVYLEQIGLEEEQVVLSLDDLPEGTGSYFSLFLISSNPV